MSTCSLIATFCLLAFLSRISFSSFGKTVHGNGILWVLLLLLIEVKIWKSISLNQTKWINFYYVSNLYLFFNCSYYCVLKELFLAKVKRISPYRPPIKQLNFHLKYFVDESGWVIKRLSFLSHFTCWFVSGLKNIEGLSSTSRWPSIPLKTKTFLPQ